MFGIRKNNHFKIYMNGTKVLTLRNFRNAQDVSYTLIAHAIHVYACAVLYAVKDPQSVD